MAWAAGATALAISARCRFIASLLQAGRIRAAPLPSLGQTAPKIIGGSGTLVARRTGAGAALRPAASDFVLLADAGLPANQISIVLQSMPFSRAAVSRRVGKLF